MLRLTAKAFALLGRQRGPLKAAEPGDDDWYVNLLWVDGRKCLLIVHAGTVFSVFVADVRAAELRPIGRFLVPLIKAELQSEGLPADCLGPMDPDDVQLGKTANRSVLGFMNDLALLARLLVEDAGGLVFTDMSELNARLRRQLHKAREFKSAMELVAESLARPAK